MPDRKAATATALAIMSVYSAALEVNKEQHVVVRQTTQRQDLGGEKVGRMVKKLNRPARHHAAS
jgi:hypothetical protein